MNSATLPAFYASGYGDRPRWKIAGGDAVCRFPSRRTVTLLRVARLSTGTDAGLCCVRAMSDVTLTLDTGLELAAGVGVEIALSDDVTHAGVVERKHGERVDIRFSRPIDAGELLKSLPLQNGGRRQRPPRLAVDIPVMAFTELGLHSVRIVNISQGGAQVSHDGSLKPDQLVTILLTSGLERRAVIRWVSDGKAGLTFLEPLSFRRLMSANNFETGCNAAR